MSPHSRSPLKDKPLRLPGQSLEEERRKLFEDKVEMPGLTAILALTMAGWEWWRYYAEKPPQPDQIAPWHEWARGQWPDLVPHSFSVPAQ